MLAVLQQWYRRYFSDPEAVVLFFILAFGVLILQTMGTILAPLLASIVIAYLLDAPIHLLIRWRCPKAIAVTVVFTLFLGVLLVASFWFLPLLWRQLTNLFNEAPIIVGKVQTTLMQLPDYYPDYVSTDQINHFILLFKSHLGKLGQVVLSVSLASIPNLVMLVVYFVLVPLLVLFILFDRDGLLAWIQSHLPKNRQTLSGIWKNVNNQIGNYVRGKVLEMIIVTIFCIAIFTLMGLQYAILLSVLVGVSVIIPFVGAVVVTIPIVIIAFIQWGFSAHFVYLIVVYAIIITLDANVLVPLLFSEAVDIHPVAIIVSIIIFGSWWGFWGVFFAIPLAAFIKTVCQAWPRTLSNQV